MYVVEKHYLAGIPQTALVGGLPSRGIAAHWTAGGTGRKGALDTAQFFIDRADRNASYHELWWWDAATGTFGVLLLVPVDRAAHSINPNPPTYAPNAEVRRILGDKVGDPNAACYAISFAGMPADLERALADPRFRTYARRRYAELLKQETTIRDPRPLFNHGWAQPTTRTDAGDRFIPMLYGEEADMPTPALDYVPQLWRAKAGGAKLREQADRSAPVVGTIPAGVILFTVGENPSSIGWRIAVAGDPRRLLFVERSEIDPLPPGGRDAELDGGINSVIGLRIDGKPVEFGSGGGVSDAELEAAIAKATDDGRKLEAAEWTKLVREFAAAEATAAARDASLRKRAGL